MRRSAVIFVLIFTLVAANIFTGCGSSASGPDNGPAKTVSGGSSDAAGKTDSAGKTGDAGKTDAAGKTGDASSIPDTNESAVTDWLRTQTERALPSKPARRLPSARC